MASGARASKRQKKQSARGARASELDSEPSTGGARASVIQKKPTARGARLWRRPSARLQAPQLIAPEPTVLWESGEEFNTGDGATVWTESWHLLQLGQARNHVEACKRQHGGGAVRGYWKRVLSIRAVSEHS